MLALSRKAKEEAEGFSSFVDWKLREDIKTNLNVKLMLLLVQYSYVPAANDDAYKEI